MARSLGLRQTGDGHAVGRAHKLSRGCADAEAVGTGGLHFVVLVDGLVTVVVLAVAVLECLRTDARIRVVAVRVRFVVGSETVAVAIVFERFAAAVLVDAVATDVERIGVDGRVVVVAVDPFREAVAVLVRSRRIDGRSQHAEGGGQILGRSLGICDRDDHAVGTWRKVRRIHIQLTGAGIAGLAAKEVGPVVGQQVAIGVVRPGPIGDGVADDHLSARRGDGKVDRRLIGLHRDHTHRGRLEFAPHLTVVGAASDHIGTRRCAAEAHQRALTGDRCGRYQNQPAAGVERQPPLDLQRIAGRLAVVHGREDRCGLTDVHGLADGGRNAGRRRILLRLWHHHDVEATLQLMAIHLNRYEHGIEARDGRRKGTRVSVTWNRI